MDPNICFYLGFAERCQTRLNIGLEMCFMAW